MLGDPIGQIAALLHSLLGVMLLTFVLAGILSPLCWIAVALAFVIALVAAAVSS